jgi:hypothetical protein
MLEKIKNNKSLSPLLNALHVEEVDDFNAAFEIATNSLATVLKATRSQNLVDLIRIANFAPLKALGLLSESDILSLEELVRNKMQTLTPADILENQIRVARLMNPIRRKKLAAYYTKPIGLKLMAHMVTQYARISEQPLILSDPFLGSGLALSETIKELNESHVDKIWGIEPDPLSAFVAYAAIINALRGAYQKVEIIVGDAFKIAQEGLLSLGDTPLRKANVILTNPPFTRWEILDEDYRTFLTKLIYTFGYNKYVKRRQQNLQLLSLFLMDHFLEKNGLLISVLPASTFYTLYGEAAKLMLRDRYLVHGLIDIGVESSFSIDSGFKEVILIASKKKSKGETAFLTIGPKDMPILEEFANVIQGNKLINNRINWVDISNVPYPWEMNWLTLAGQNPLRELLTRIFSQAIKKDTVTFWANSIGKKRLVRGIEMYGPDFFFIPNKYWKIAQWNYDGVMIEDYQSEVKLLIGNEFVVPALRKPELYVDSIVPMVDHYLLSIPPKAESELPSDIAEYIRWGQLHSTAKPAIRSFGRYWYSHINKQINVKKPFGHVFLPDKIDPSFNKRGVFACYSDQRLTASKNFYIATFGDELKDKSLSLWFNSSLFLAYFLVASRKISERWTRFLEADYLRLPIVNIEVLDEGALQRLGSNFDKVSVRKLPSIPTQLGEDYRFEMDNTIFESIKVEDSAIVQELYALLKKYLAKEKSSE